ncbi:MAG: ribbon-helix-helix domain-containing protein [Gammaproteobacteria bacterium]
MNFSIHLPDPLMERLDAFARGQAVSRSSVIREAVKEYLARRALQAWPADLESWMRQAPTGPAEVLPDFAAVRSEMNAGMRKRSPRRRSA